jgi:hypothetical protein
VEVAVGLAVELAGRLDDDEDDGKTGEAAPDLLEPLARVGNAERQAKWVHINVEPLFTGVDAERRLGFARLVRARPCLAYGTCSPSSVQAKREGRTDQALPRFSPRVGGSRPPDLGRVATLPRSARILQ